MDTNEEDDEEEEDEEEEVEEEEKNATTEATVYEDTKRTRAYDTGPRRRRLYTSTRPHRRPLGQLVVRGAEVVPLGVGAQVEIIEATFKRGSS